MQKKFILGAIFAVLLAVASVPLAFAGGDRTGGGNGHENGDDVQILQVTLKHGPFTELDQGDPGPSAGDRFIFFGDVFRNDKQVGVGGGECVTMLFRPGPDPAGEPEAVTDQCAATLSLRRGQITVQGLAERIGPEPLTLPITGGTGAYRTAHGEMETAGPDEAGNELLTLRLILGDD